MDNQKGSSTNGLILYYHPHSFYSQKILFVLHEKNLKFIPYEVDITNGEQYSQWFLELNPKGEVPVLKDGTLIIPESGRIINYLEDHYQSDNIPRLIPFRINRTILEKILYFHRNISKMPIGAISLGSFIHTDLCPNPKPPFIGIVRNSFLKTDEKISTVLQEYAKINPVHAEILIDKSRFQEKKRLLIEDRDKFMKIVSAIETILTEVENELCNHPEQWLCHEEFTIADISLTMLLYRLYSLGFEDYLWKNKHKHIDQYYQRVCQRDTFKRTLPTTFSTIKTIWSKTPIGYKFGLSTISAAVLLASIIVQRS